ncbi:MAG: carbohydrate binding domain-containing protein [Victivallales bacterium]
MMKLIRCPVFTLKFLGGILLFGMTGITLALAAAKDVNLMDLKWEGDLSRVADVEKIKNGDSAIRWDAGHQPYSTALIKLSGEKGDLSDYTTLHFWAFSESATGAAIVIQAVSPNTNEDGDYFLMGFEVKWKGWKEFNLPLDKFTNVRSPKGWDSITRLSFLGHFNTQPVPGTILYLSDIRLTID